MTVDELIDRLNQLKTIPLGLIGSEIIVVQDGDGTAYVADVGATIDYDLVVLTTTYERPEVQDARPEDREGAQNN